MKFRFTEEQDAFREDIKTFIQDELPPELLAGADPYEDDCFEDTMAFRRKLGQKKWIGIGWPVEYGGLGATPMMQAIFHEEMLYHNAPLDPQAYQVGPAIIAHGAEHLKQEFLAATANQELIWCQGFSEPNAGSDLANVQTRAQRDGDDFVINGQKIWTSYAHRADWIHILTRTDPDAPKHRGITYFVLDMSTPGITIRPLIDMSGAHHFNEVFFDNVRVPSRNIIGEENMGWYVATTTLDNERSGIRNYAGARRGYDELLAAIREAPTVAAKAHDVVTAHKLADLRVQLAASRMLCYRVAWMQTEGQQPNMEASMAKIFATQLQQLIVKLGMEILGMYGAQINGSKHALAAGAIPDGYLGMVCRTISAGSSEINRNIIATRGLGLPRG